MCLPGQKGERLGKRGPEEIFRPSVENDTRTFEDEEASKAPFPEGSNAAWKLGGYGRLMVVAATITIIGVMLYYPFERRQIMREAIDNFLFKASSFQFVLIRFGMLPRFSISVNKSAGLMPPTIAISRDYSHQHNSKDILLLAYIQPKSGILYLEIHPLAPSNEHDPSASITDSTLMIRGQLKRLHLLTTVSCGRIFDISSFANPPSFKSSALPMASLLLWLPLLFAAQVLALTHLVCVGCFERDFTAQFTPPSLTAAVGDFVEFQWHKGDAMAHSVTRGSYNGFPCQPGIDGTEEGKGRESAVSSGFIDRFGWDYNTWTVQINDTDPLWYYDCSDCSVRMAGVINPPTNPLDGNITEWQAAAIFSIRPITELERCTLGEKGGRFAHLSTQEMWNPDNENSSKTVEDTEGAVEKEKARWSSVSSEVATAVPTPSSTDSGALSSASSPTSANSSSGISSMTSETSFSRTESSTASPSASPSTLPTTSNAAFKLGGGKVMMALIGATCGMMWYAWV